MVIPQLVMLSNYKTETILLFSFQVLLEKLLYSCPKLDKVYILVREKKGVNIDQRIRSMIDQPLFTRLRTERPQTFEKIVPIVGDIAEPRLGIKAEDEEILIKEVSIVFHVAATVNFKEKLDVAMNINVAGTERMLDLTRRMENVKCFVYVSTVYSNPHQKVIEEVLYPEPISLEEIRRLLKVGITDDQLNEILKDRPNTYSFTKALTEHVVAKNHGTIPTIIVRPSIVSSIKMDPIVGWVDNWFGATGNFTTMFRGLNRIVFTRPDNILDLIPVDYVSNLIIVAASKMKSSKDVEVYNSSTSAENPLTMHNAIKLAIEYSYKYKAYDVPLPFVLVTRFRWLLFLVSIIFEKIPAYIADAFLWLRRKTVRYSKFQAKVSLIRTAYEYFTDNSWIICASKTRALFDSLSPSDKIMFPCDPKDIVWEEYMFSYFKGIRQFLLK
ncbi:unnamed protein product [Euphydryas editha]|uniref:Fatty acyl-CoA reductase n=1 Tax=Euphydryas editha TaxID=104508 RepID=A0AAU9VEB3_EUPED|nr:unnamed protein product [Euphydryas editha]